MTLIDALKSGRAVAVRSKVGGVFYIDSEDLPVLGDSPWNTTPVAKGNSYVFQRRNKVKVMLHRVLMGVVGEREKLVDHIDGNGLNNCRSNLRIVTHLENAQNRKGSGARKYSKYKGVCIANGNTKKPWKAQIMASGKMRYSAAFDTEEEAAAEYDRMAIEFHGVYARLNFPPKGQELVTMVEKLPGSVQVTREMAEQAWEYLFQNSNAEKTEFCRALGLSEGE